MTDLPRYALGPGERSWLLSCREHALGVRDTTAHALVAQIPFTETAAYLDCGQILRLVEAAIRHEHEQHGGRDAAAATEPKEIPA